jgi:hypothetical protein
VAESVPTASTRLLRRSDEPLFQRLRALLSERDVDPQTAILADFFPDDVDQEFGLVVTQDRRVIQFVVHYCRLGDLKRQAADAVIGEWNDISSGWRPGPRPGSSAWSSRPPTVTRASKHPACHLRAGPRPSGYPLARSRAGCPQHPTSAPVSTEQTKLL